MQRAVAPGVLALAFAAAILVAVTSSRARVQAQTGRSLGLILGVTVSSDGVSVPGAIVSLVARRPSQDAAFTQRRVIATKDGRFLFEAVPAGQYELHAAAPGFVEGGYGKTRPDGAVRVFFLRHRQVSTDLRITLWKRGAISGRLVDQFGEPVVRMPVIASLHQTTLSANWAESQFLTRSDDRGEYRIFGLPAGSYKVRAGSVSSSRPLSLTDSLTNAAERSGDAPAATETDLRRSGVVPMFSGGMRLGDWLLSTTGAAAVGLAGFSTGGGLTVYRSAFFGGPGHLPTAVHVKPGDERLGVDLVLDRVQAVPLTGRLIAPPGLAEHVALQLVSGTVDALERNDALDVASTVTSPGGEFSFLGVPAGEYLVMARKTSGGSAGPTVADAGPRAPEEVLWALEPIVSNELQTVHHRVQLRPGLSIAGRIRFDDAPQNARDVRIAVDPVGVAPRRTETRARVAADVSGHFRTGPLLPGLYRLRAAGPAGSTLATVMRGGKELPGGVLALRTDVNDLELRFVRSGTLVEGSVLDRQGRTAGRATVILFSASPEAWNAFETRRLQTAATSDEGRYAFREVPPGEYFLIALADASFPEDWRSSETLARLMPVSKRVTIVAGRHEMVMLREQKP